MGCLKWHIQCTIRAPRVQICQQISLGDVRFRANTERFQGSVPLLPHLCPLSVPNRGGRYVGYIRKALENGYLEHPGSACCTDDMFEIVIPFGRCPCCLLPPFVNRQLPCLHTNSQRAVASPDAPQKPLVRKRARSGGANWVKVTRDPATQAKKPCAASSQQPACSHEEHQILSTTEAAAFATQFWVHPSKASQHEFLATCIDVDLEQKVKHAGWQKYTRWSPSPRGEGQQ